MKFSLSTLFAITIIAILFSSCKLDKPIYPTKPSVVNLKNLTGTYYVRSDFSQYYDTQTDSPYVSTQQYPSLFKRVILNDSLKTGIVTYYPDSSVNFTYTLSTQSDKTFITFNKDVLPRSTNNKIQITVLNDASMQWLAIDPAVINWENGTAYLGYGLNYERSL